MPYRKQITVDDVLKAIPPSIPRKIPPMPMYRSFDGKFKPYVVQCNECGEDISSYDVKKKTYYSVVWICDKCNTQTETLNYKETLRWKKENSLWNRFCKWFKEN